jgi:hypothetical protein
LLASSGSRSLTHISVLSRNRADSRREYGHEILVPESVGCWRKEPDGEEMVRIYRTKLVIAALETTTPRPKPGRVKKVS